MAITISGNRIQITGSETVDSVFSDALNSPAGDVGVFLDRQAYSNNAETDLYHYTLKNNYIFAVQSGGVLNHQDSILTITGIDGNDALVVEVGGEFISGTASVINGVTYPDHSTIIIQALGDTDGTADGGDWSQRGFYIKGIARFNGNVWSSGRRNLSADATALLDLNCRWHAMHRDFGQQQLLVNSSATITGEYFELVQASTNANFINAPSFPNNTFLNGVTSLEMSPLEVINNLNFNVPIFNIIPSKGGDIRFKNPKRDGESFSAQYVNSNTYGTIEARHDLAVKVVDENFTAITSLVNITDTDNGLRRSSGVYLADQVYEGTTDASGDISFNPLFWYYNADPIESGTPPIDKRYPLKVTAYSYLNNASQVLITTYEGSFNQTAISTTDSNITNLDEAAVLVYTSQETPERCYDHLKSLWVRDFANDSVYVSRIGDSLDFGTRDVTVNATGTTGEAVVTGSSVTLYGGFSGNINTTGIVTGKTNVTGSVIDATQDATLSEAGGAIFDVYPTDADRSAKTNALATGVTGWGVIISTLPTSTVYVSAVFGSTLLPYDVPLTAGTNTFDSGVAGQIASLRPPILETQANTRQMLSPAP